MTCADFLAHPPDFDWVRLEGCAAASDHLGIETFQPENAPAGSYSNVTAIYVPLSVAGQPYNDERNALVLRVDHGPILRLGSRSATDAEINAADEVLAAPIEGLVERSLDRSARDREKIRTLGMYLSDDFLIVDHDARPRPLWLGLGSLGVGLGAFAWLSRKWRRRRRPVDLAKAKLVAG